METKMKFEIGDKVTLVESTNYFLQDVIGKTGIIVAALEKAFCPYQVKFKEGRRWCKEEELELYSV